MSPVAANKDKSKTHIVTAAKLQDYSREPAFKKKAAEALTFIKKHGLPKSPKKKQDK